MIRLLQILLGFMILYFLYLAIVSGTVMLPLMIMRDQKEPASFKGVNYSLKRESVLLSPARIRLVKIYEYDSSKKAGKLSTYAETSRLKALILVNDTPYVRDKNSEMVPVKVDKETRDLQVPIQENQFRVISFTFIAVIIVYILFILYLSWQLFQFAQKAGKKDFFNRTNRARLRLLGTFLILTSCFNFLAESSGRWIFEKITGTSGYQEITNNSVLMFPSVLIAGLLMFIIAEAFSKGQQLQTDQEYTI